MTRQKVCGDTVSDYLTAVDDSISDDCIVLGNGEHDAAEPFTFSAFFAGFPQAIRTQLTPDEFAVLKTVLLRAAHENRLSINGEIRSTSE